MNSCHVCGKSFTKKYSLYRHVRGIHKIEPLSRTRQYDCGDCGKAFGESYNLIRHLRQTHRRETYAKCTECNSIFGDKTALVDHFQNKHNVFDSQPCTTSELAEVNSDHTRFFRVYEIVATSHQTDVDNFMLTQFQKIKEHVKCINEEIHAMKIQVSVCMIMVKPTTLEEIEICCNSLMTPIFDDGLTEEKYEIIKNHVLSTVENFCQNGSGWVTKNIKQLKLNICKMKSPGGGSYIPTPLKFVNNKFLLNIHTKKTNNCFELCLIASQNRVTNHPERPQTYLNNGSIDMCGLVNPIKISDISKIEKANHLSISVFALEKSLYPLRVSINNGQQVDLLLLEADGRFHYVLITNFNGFMRRLEGKFAHYLFCRRCLHGCAGKVSFKNHRKLCENNEPCRINMPTQTTMKWQRLSARACVPYIIYADLEAITPKISGCTPTNEQSFTVQLEKQVPCGAHAALVHDGVLNNEVLFRGEDCINNLLNVLREWAKTIYHKKQAFRFFNPKPVDRKTLENTTMCWLCEYPLNDDKVYDHNHETGELRGVAHSECNLACRTPRFTPVIFHNGSGYDFRHILKHYKAEGKEKLECIPSNEETCISLSLKIPVDKYIDKHDKEITVYEELRFIDSFRFLNKSLNSLALTLIKDEIPLTILRDGFKHLDEPQLSLITRKGVYPYSFIDSFKKFNEKKLPDKWIDMLTGSIVSDDDYHHAQNVWEKLKIINMGDYHDLYLRTDVFLLAEVFENFRRLCYKTYGLDPAHYFTIPNFAWDAMLKTTNVELQLIQEREHLDLVKSSLRGGMCGVYSHRYFKANNPQCPDFEKTEKTTWLMLLDANNLYGGVMRESLPYGNLKDVQISLQEILNTPDNSELGYFVTVDLKYPTELHDKHNDYPLAPEHVKPRQEWLSSIQKKILADRKYKPTKKLMQTLYDKRDYTCHYRILKFYLRHGLKVQALKRVVQFTQGQWMKSYIDKNTELRKQASTDCQKDLGKLLNNAVFGKSMENILKRVNVKFLSSKKEYEKHTKKPNFKHFTIIQPELTAVTMGKTSVLWNKPTFVGSAVLDLSKLVMFEFVYDVLKPKYGENVSVLYSDTDSLLISVQTDDIYTDIASMADRFDLSEYPKDHELYNPTNAKVVLKFKDEFKSEVMTEYIGLKPKMYSMCSTSTTKQSAKGVRGTTKKTLNHEIYRSVLENQLTLRREMINIRSRQMDLFVEKNNKIALSCFDDKRYFENESTMAFGHHTIVNDPQATEEPDSEIESSLDGCEEEEFENSITQIETAPDEINLDPGFWRTEQVMSDDEDLYIPPKKLKPNAFIIYEASEV